MHKGNLWLKLELSISTLQVFKATDKSGYGLGKKCRLGS